MKAVRLRIKLRAYDHGLLDNSVNEIVQTAKETGAKIAGPIPLPTEINKFTVLDQFTKIKNQESNLNENPQETCGYSDPTQQTVDSLMKLDLSSGVDVEIKY